MNIHQEFNSTVTYQSDKSSLAKDYPLCAQSVDLFKQLFGAGLKVEAAYENDSEMITKAKRAEDLMIQIDGEQFLRLGKLAKMHADGMSLIEDSKRARK